jgi:diguanylate cyclase (GGDEF)-like protein
MRETLHDRFRAFKPYDLALALVMLVLIVSSAPLLPGHRAVVLAGGMMLFWLLDIVQRWVRSPTPAWQAIAIVLANTTLVCVLLHLNSARPYTLAFSMLNVAFATVAFGQHAGIIAAFLSVATLSQLELFEGGATRPFIEWLLFLVVLLCLVAILDRVNRLQKDALFDVVTGLRNHRYFQVRLREELARAERYNRPTSLLLLDLDNFKRVNDMFGHAVGDTVLAQIARLLERSARSADVVCRYGGEEIAIILAETPLDEAVKTAERLRREVERRPDDRGATVTISVGVATFPDHAEFADGLIAAADAAMYRAKRAGKNRVEVATRWNVVEPLESQAGGAST